jgi:glyoxylase-like metal-dependent hydrolase (beta-lactamase superfamily II)
VNSRGGVVAAGTLALVALCAREARAQVDLTGTWSPRYQEDFSERIPGPELGDYTGLPLTDGARRAAETWDPDEISLPEEQCRVHISPYIYRGPTNIGIWEERDPKTRELIAIKHRISTFDQERTIYMDGRAHPPAYAPHTWMGFSTGKWQGNMLVVTTTHIKKGWLRRNGVPESDLATLTEYFVRAGDVLTRISSIDDPVYLTEPLVKSEEFVLNTQGVPHRAWLFQCKAVVEVVRPEGAVPHYLPGTNPYLAQYRERYKLSEGQARGGAALNYPGGTAPAVAPLGVTKTAPAQTMAASGTVEVWPVQGNVYMLVSAEGNMVMHAGAEGVLLVDTLRESLSPAVLAAIRTVSDKPIHYIVNTQAGADHTGGNEALAKAGPTRPGRDPLGSGVGGNTGGTTSIVAHENVLNRMSATVAGGGTARPRASWPGDTFFQDQNDIFFNDEAVQVLHQPAANDDGDSIVFFRRSDVIAAGDVFSTVGYPVFDRAQGGSINGVIDALNRIIRLAVPTHNQEGGTMIVPGHGRVGDEMDVVEYRNMVTIVRDRVQALIKQGRTLDQIKAAQPTLDYDARYAAASGPGSADAFISAVYESLRAVAPAPAAASSKPAPAPAKGSK